MGTEEDFLELLKSGNETAYYLLVNRYSSRVYNLCLRLLPSNQDAEDITQEVFTTLFLSISTFRNESALSTWIHRITVNKCHEFNRKKQRKKRAGKLISLDTLSVAKDMSQHSNPSSLLEQKEFNLMIDAIILSLPENQRTAFTLSKLEGMKNEEISTIMNVSISAVESLVFRAKRTVIQKLLEHTSIE
jgi:RNA polymerase sigma-70 factor (ECF subfamily)